MGQKRVFWRGLVLAVLGLAVSANGAPTFNVLAKLAPGDGSSANTGVVVNNGLFGTTGFGGPDGKGTIYSVVPGSGVAATVATFSAATGYYPSGLIVGSGGVLYGVTGRGGANDMGTLFKYTPSGGSLTKLFDFSPTTGAPGGGLVLRSGLLYGTAVPSGAGGVTNVFRILQSGGGFQTVTSFSAQEQSNPGGALSVDAAGNLFVVNGGLGAGLGGGAVRRINVSTGVVTKLGNVDSPMGNLVADVAGNMYGSAYYGGTIGGYLGMVFEIESGSNTLTELAAFNLSNYPHPLGNLAVDALGNVFGTTYGANTGSLFEIVAGSHAITTLLPFDATTGGWPLGGIVADGQGKLYGTMQGGGNVFEITDTGFATSAPEPGTFGALAVAVLSVLGRRRRGAAASGRRW